MSHQQNFWSINGSFLGNIVESTMEVDAFISNGERATRQGDQNYIKALELGNQRLNGKLIRALCENRNLSVIMETLLELHPFELIDIVQLLQISHLQNEGSPNLVFSHMVQDEGMDVDMYTSNNHRATEQGYRNCKAVLEEKKKMLEEKLITSLWVNMSLTHNVFTLLNFISSKGESSLAGFPPVFSYCLIHNYLGVP